jgi:hypothetical protein
MTERDDSSKGFLERWSRKKIDAEHEAPAAPAAKVAAPIEENSTPEQHAKAEAKAPAQAAAKPEFDLASLPSLDSITAMTDVRAFLAPGVPKELARAALRRAWSADPAVSDFVGLAENAWDFTDPTAMPGFGALPPGYDVKKLMAQIFSGGEKPAEPDAATDKPAEPQATQIAEQIAPTASPATVTSSAAPKDKTGSSDASAAGQQVAQSDFVQRDNNIASHNGSSDEATDERKNRRQHGGALPQ